MQKLKSISPASYDATVARVAELLSTTQRLLVITGAGISADSGLPTYRGIGGLYDDTVTEDAMPIETALSGGMLDRAPEVTWKYIAQIEAARRGAEANVAHRTLSDLQSVCGHVCVLTQNVDGFHRAAGSQDVIEMHGNIHELHCTSCAYETWVEDFAGLQSIPPSCPRCDSLVRPRVVLFGEMLPDTALDHYYATLDEGVDMVMVIGTTAVFPYISAPVEQASCQGIPTVEINPGETVLSEFVDYRLAARAAIALPDIYTALGRN